MAYNEIQEALLDAMQIIAEAAVENSSSYDKSDFVYVTAVNGNKYSVIYNGLTYDNLQCDQGSLSVGDKTIMTTLSNGKKVLVGKGGSTDYSVDGVTIKNEGGVLTGNYIGGDGIQVVGNVINNTGGGGGSSTYYAGDGIDISNSTINVKYDNSTIILSNNKLTGNYKAGTGIKINGNTISGNYTAGFGIKIEDGVISMSYSTITGDTEF